MVVPTKNPYSLTHMGRTPALYGAHMCVGCGGFLVGKPRWDANSFAHTKPAQYNTQWAEHWHYMGPMCVGCGGFLIGKPRWDANGRANNKKPTQSNTHGPHIGIIWGLYVFWLWWVLVGKPRWDVNGRAHMEPTQSNTYGLHIGIIWAPLSVGCRAFLIENPR